MRIRELKRSDSKDISTISKILSKYFTPAARRNIRRVCKTQNGFVVVEERVIGFLLYRKWKYTAVITWMGVLPEYQNKGIGKSLLKTLENELRKHGISELRVSTLAPTVKYKPYEKTRRFYFKNGFQKYRIDKKFYPDGSDRLVLLKDI
ncbi:MAG: GNAT family N-acetyltransferase [Candidatus Aenigmarchaeota archaeon]|nr:GNAT family N-acetyltransferase [Candidatus Aenigmarchaeota archaeon]